MSKYKELMSRIEMTPQMKSRILEKVENIDINAVKPATKKTNKILYWGVVAAAACLIVVIGASIMLSDTIRPGNSGGNVEQTVYTEDFYNSADELKNASGMPIKDIENLPMEVSEVKYVHISNLIAQISYFDSEGNEICYRITEGDEDNSGVYEEFENIDIIDIDDVKVTVKGNAGNAAVAVWVKDQYSYSIYATKDISSDEMLNIIDEILAQ